VVPEDEKIVISTNRGEPAVADESSKAGKAYRNMVSRLLGQDVPLMTMENVEPSFFDKLRMFFGLKART